jgi:hypothetical protein
MLLDRREIRVAIDEQGGERFHADIMVSDGISGNQKYSSIEQYLRDFKGCAASRHGTSSAGPLNFASHV